MRFQPPTRSLWKCIAWIWTTSDKVLGKQRLSRRTMVRCVTVQAEELAPKFRIIPRYAHQTVAIECYWWKESQRAPFAYAVYMVEHLLWCIGVRARMKPASLPPARTRDCHPFSPGGGGTKTLLRTFALVGKSRMTCETLNRSIIPFMNGLDLRQQTLTLI